MKSEIDGWNFMAHDDRGAPVWNTEAAGSTKGVKFGDGFQRRRAEHIGHDADRKRFEAQLEERKAVVAEARRDALESLDKVCASVLLRCSACALALWLYVFMGMGSGHGLLSLLLFRSAMASTSSPASMTQPRTWQPAPAGAPSPPPSLISRRRRATW